MRWSTSTGCQTEEECQKKGRQSGGNRCVPHSRTKLKWKWSLETILFVPLYKHAIVKNIEIKRRRKKKMTDEIEHPSARRRWMTSKSFWTVEAEGRGIRGAFFLPNPSGLSCLVPRRQNQGKIKWTAHIELKGGPGYFDWFLLFIIYPGNVVDVGSMGIIKKSTPKSTGVRGRMNVGYRILKKLISDWLMNEFCNIFVTDVTFLPSCCAWQVPRRKFLHYQHFQVRNFWCLSFPRWERGSTH